MNPSSHGAVQMTAMRYDAGRPKAVHPAKVQDLSLRDGHQPLFATRGRTEDLLSVAGDMDKGGFHSLEVWGGATFDTSLAPCAYRSSHPAVEAGVASLLETSRDPGGRGRAQGQPRRNS